MDATCKAFRQPTSGSQHEARQQNKNMLVLFETKNNIASGNRAFRDKRAVIIDGAFMVVW